MSYPIFIFSDEIEHAVQSLTKEEKKEINK